jgi:AraC family transcriptional regulator
MQREGGGVIRGQLARDRGEEEIDIPARNVGHRCQGIRVPKAVDEFVSQSVTGRGHGVPDAGDHRKTEVREGCSTKPEYDARLLLRGDTVTAWDVVCQGLCRGKADEEWSPGIRMVFPYRGVYVHSVGTQEHVGEANQVVVINADEPYRVSHPVAGGDATLTIGVDAASLLEITPAEYRRTDDRPALNRSGFRIDAFTQLVAAQLRQRLLRRSIGQLEAETLALQLVRHTLGDITSHTVRRGNGRPEKMADEVKLLLSTDPWRRWTLDEIANEVSVTPVYLTDAFRRVEGVPLYRYHLRLRLAQALAVLADCDDLTALAVELGFNSHSHFTAAFKKTFRQTPSVFKRSMWSKQRVGPCC